MAQVNILASYAGYVYKSDHDYYTCRDASSGTTSDDGGYVGQKWQVTGSWYYVYRSFIYFNTSTMPDDAIITAATITFTEALLYDGSDTDFNIIVRGANSASNPIILGDYDLTNYDGENLGELTTSGNYLSFTLNNDGLSYINKTGTTQFVLLSEEDIDNSPPTGDETVIYDTGVEGNKIRITITYFEPTAAPTVSTIDEDCEDRQATTLTAVGDVTSTGDGYTYRGFEYHEYSADDEYDYSMYAVREIGRFHELGEFRMTLYGLKPSTVYSIRAYAGNIFGVSYGDWVLCSTLGTTAPTYEVYEEETTPTICFYVSEDDGHTWSLKFGPYTEDQVDIAITKILVRGSGKKQIKFTTDALTGLSASVMCKLDIKAR